MPLASDAVGPPGRVNRPIPSKWGYRDATRFPHQTFQRKAAWVSPGFGCVLTVASCTIRPGTPGWSSGDPGERHSAGKIVGIDLDAVAGEGPLRPAGPGRRERGSAGTRNLFRSRDTSPRSPGRTITIPRRDPVPWALRAVSLVTRRHDRSLGSQAPDLGPLGCRPRTLAPDPRTQPALIRRRWVR